MRNPSFPATLPASLVAALDGEMIEIEFTPVPRLRQRRSGWTEAKQRGFIAALTACGSVCAAARAVGMSPRSVYRLCDADGADSFCAAWDEAIETGLAKMQADALGRALHGGFVPVYRRGKLVRVEHRFNDRLAIALLKGGDNSIDTYRRMAVGRREYRADMRGLDDARAEDVRRAEAYAAYRAEVEAIVSEEDDKLRRATLPRIRRL